MVTVDELKFDEKGLIPAVVQDFRTGEVLMVAYMNRESLGITIKEGRTCFYSRSRQKLWRKGETSGNIQLVKEIYADCDKDCLLVKVEQIGAACHTGNRSCFFNKMWYDMNTGK
ncbi:MAG: phosphoribosyl-AMP cyclohydrolase [Candidatus Neomarinimicrobiota bacterium]|nr:phosphoribosyl-AMP cyclohydrolase [Candidatus Neomarinimicrobiota bacterium]RKY47815.1 MAG: phosphoribosyl-AMP cyclohydrolase [Candidatus Neomarinimicrobiota bacterium]